MNRLPRLFDLTGRVALVAGATRGIGRAIVDQFIALGGSVTIASRDENACEQTARSLNESHSRVVAAAHSFDLSLCDSIPNLVEATTRHWGRIDALFANAYRAVSGFAAKTSDADFVNILRDNIIHNSHLAHAALPSLQQTKGSIIFIASASGLAPSPSMAAYGVAKRGLIHLMQNLAVQWGPLGVRVNAVAPGMTRTPSVTENISALSLTERVRGLPIARLGEPEEIAATAVFLATPAAGFVTGHTIVADGGRTLLSGNTGGALDFD